MDLSVELRNATQEAHRAAESRTFQKSLVGGALAKDQLILYLSQLRAIHACLERMMDEHGDVAKIIGWPDHMARHSRNLEADIQALSGESASTNDDANLPATRKLIETVESEVQKQPESLLGFVYVLEGSMNGNRFIVRGLRAGPLAGQCKFEYFDPYKGEQTTVWGRFKEGLAQVSIDPEAGQTVISAALCMFEGVAAISDEVAEATTAAESNSA
jgi:heme oxygenase